MISIHVMSDTMPLNISLNDVAQEDVQQLLNRVYENGYYSDASKLAELIEQRYVFCDASYANANADNYDFLNHTCWRSQRMFLLAFNENSIDEFLKVSHFFGVPPSIIFEGSLAGEQKTKYAVFFLQQDIKDLRMRYAVIASLRRLFYTKERLNSFETAINESFNSFKLLQFQNVDILFTDNDACIDVLHLLDVTSCKVHSEGGTHGDRAMTDFFEAIFMYPYHRGALIQIFQELPKPKNDFNISLKRYFCNVITPQYSARVFFSITIDAFIVFIKKIVDKVDSVAALKNIREEIGFEVDSIRWNVVDNLEELIAENSGCILLRDILIGKNVVGIKELRQLAIVLRHLKGIQTLIANHLKFTNKYDKTTITMFKSFMERYRRVIVGRYTLPCNEFCNCVEECQGRNPYYITDMLDILPQKIGSIRKLVIEPRAIETASAMRRRIQADFESDLELEKVEEDEELTADGSVIDGECLDIDKDNVQDSLEEQNGIELSKASEEQMQQVFVYKCFVGLGKTHMYVSKAKELIKRKKTVVIAFPDHGLKDDVKERLFKALKTKALQKKVVVVPNKPSISPEFDRMLDSLYSIGATKLIKRQISAYIKNVIKVKPEQEWSESEKQLIEYYNIPRLLHRKNYVKGKIILCTHERLFQLEDLNIDYTIVDEDITNTLLKQGQVDMLELERLRGILRNSNDEKRLAVLELVNQILGAQPDKMHTSKSGQRAWGIITDIMVDNIADFNSKVTELLFDSDAYIKNQYSISYIIRRYLKLKGKLFIMSATANRQIYEQLFGRDIIFREYGVPRMKADFKMMYKYSYSRSWMENNKAQFYKVGEAILDNDDFSEEKEMLRRWGVPENLWDMREDFLVITHKKYEEEFKKLGFVNTMHYGKLTGIDAYNGRNLIVFGTPHANAISYALITKVLFPSDNLTAIPRLERDVLVNRNGYSFYFTTVSEESNFREIQFWIIESEMIQAIGRARPIDNKCKIYVWSNLPLPYIDLQLESWDDYM